MKFLCQVDWKHGVSRGILLSLAATDAPLACSCPAVSPQGRRRGCGASITRVTKAPQYFESIAAHTSRKMVANPPCPFQSVLSAVPWHQASLPPGRVSPHARRMGPQYSHCAIFEKKNPEGDSCLLNEIRTRGLRHWSRHKDGWMNRSKDMSWSKT